MSGEPLVIDAEDRLRQLCDKEDFVKQSLQAAKNAQLWGGLDEQLPAKKPSQVDAELNRLVKAIDKLSKRARLHIMVGTFRKCNDALPWSDDAVDFLNVVRDAALSDRLPWRCGSVGRQLLVREAWQVARSFGLLRLNRAEDSSRASDFTEYLEVLLIAAEMLDPKLKREQRNDIANKLVRELLSDFPAPERAKS